MKTNQAKQENLNVLECIYSLVHYRAKNLTLLFLAAFSLSSCEPVFAEPNYEKLANAIHLTENGRQNIGEAYGIHSVHYKDETEARQICIRTCKRAWRDHQGDYLLFLAKRYCPVNWQVWKKNVSFFMGGEK